MLQYKPSKLGPYEAYFIAHHEGADFCVGVGQTGRIRRSGQDWNQVLSCPKPKGDNGAQRIKRMHRLNEAHLSSLNEPPSSGPPWWSLRKQWGYYREGHQTSQCNYTASVQTLQRVHCNSSHLETLKSNCHALWLTGSLYKWRTEDTAGAKAPSRCIKYSSSNRFIPCCTSDIAADRAAGQRRPIALLSLINRKLFKAFIHPCPSPTTAPTWRCNERLTPPFTSTTYLPPSPTSVLFCDLYLTAVLCLQMYMETPLHWLYVFFKRGTVLLHLLPFPRHIG